MAMSKKKNSVAVNTVRTLEDIEIKEHDFELAGDKQNVHMDNTFVNISFWKDAVKRFRSNKMAVVSLVAILLIILLAALLLWYFLVYKKRQQVQDDGENGGEEEIYDEETRNAARDEDI